MLRLNQVVQASLNIVGMGEVPSASASKKLYRQQLQNDCEDSPIVRGILVL